MRTLPYAASLVVTIALLGACAHPGSTSTQESVTQVAVGAKTDLYEVVAPNALQLAPGVRAEVTDGPAGPGSGFLLMRQNETGGYMACGCVGAQTSSCRTENDNPEHPSCSGSCTDSEGNPHGCDLFGKIGPPRDPLHLRLLARPL